MRLNGLAALLCISALSLRCASIIHGTTQVIPITSEPSGASAELKCLEGKLESGRPTPTSVVLKRSKVSCSIIVSKDGYEPVAFQLQRSLSGWYIANILIGGVIGFIVDAADGAMFNQSPSQIHAVLYPPLAQSTTAKIRMVNSLDSVVGCTFVADTDPQMRCPKPYEEPSACIAWQAATRYGGNTVLLDGEQGHVYRCEVKSK